MTVLAKEKRLLLLWLWSGIILVTIMVAVGGITRLTGSGLSIVKWDIVTGTLPPLSYEQWGQTFNEYQQTPQFKQINHSFTLQDFKRIFWWEYFHRLTGRLIGVIFLVPYLSIMIKSKWPMWLKKRLSFILVLGMLQGLMGWIMVKSGLNDLPYVSHYRLAMHLCLALVLIGTILWTTLDVNGDEKTSNVRRQTPYLFYFAFASLIIQIIIGAFVAGLKAGFYYNTFPQMGESLFPPGLFATFYNGVLIQFIHRWFAFAVSLLVILTWVKYRNEARIDSLVNLWLVGVVVQVVLGVATLLYGVPVLLGVLHQLVATALFGVSVALLFYLSPGKNSYRI